MPTEDEADVRDDQRETARTVGQLVKYSRELNQSDSVAAVATYALEATFHVLDGHPSPTVVEVRDGDLHVVETMAADLATDGPVARLAERAYDRDRTVLLTGDDTTVNGSFGELEAVSPGDVGVDPDETPAVTLASPSYFEEEPGDTGVVVVVQWTGLDAVEPYHVKPVEYLTDHVATAVTNIRSHERLERARTDLETRKEMIELYDRLLRHDLGNDLQVIAGFSEVLVDVVDDDQGEEYAEKIHRTAVSAADLVERVGDVVKTLENEGEPVARDLAPILTGVIDDVDAKFESLTVEYDPAAADYEVYAGDLLDSVFTNVASNAAVHNEGEVTLAVSVVEPSPDVVTVVFADDGRGVDSDVRDELFRMGRKGPNSDGTGFGLGFTRALVESYGGGVAVGESELGGAAFQVTLPRP